MVSMTKHEIERFFLERSHPMINGVSVIFFKEKKKRLDFENSLIEKKDGGVGRNFIITFNLFILYVHSLALRYFQSLRGQ